MTRPNRREVREKIEEILSLGRDQGSLTRWEEGFLVDMADILDQGHGLTLTQEEKLEEIFQDQS